MPAFGKVHSSIHTAADRVKSGLKWGHHKYRQGLHIAGRANAMFETGKKIAGIFMPELERLGMDSRVMQGLGAMDKMRSGMINRHQDVLDHIGENSALGQDQAKPADDATLYGVISNERGNSGGYYYCGQYCNRSDLSYPLYFSALLRGSRKAVPKWVH